MADVKFDKSKFTKKLKGLLDNAPYERIGRTVVESIRNRVRQGISPATGRTIPELKDSTIARRSKLAPINRTSKFFETGKSNLTFSGQLLNALTSKVFRQPGSVLIKVFTEDDPRRPYQGLKGKALRAPNNSQLQKEMEEGDPTKGREPRPYLGLDKPTEAQVQKIIEAHIRNELAKKR